MAQAAATAAMIHTDVERLEPSPRCQQEPSLDRIISAPEHVGRNPVLQGQRWKQIDRRQPEPQRAGESAARDEPGGSFHRAQSPAAIEHVHRQHRQREQQRRRQMRHRQRRVAQRQQDRSQARSVRGAADRQSQHRQHGVSGELGVGAAIIVIEQMVGRRDVGERAKDRGARRCRFGLQPGVHRHTRDPERDRRRERQEPGTTPTACRA